MIIHILFGGNQPDLSTNCRKNKPETSFVWRGYVNPNIVTKFINII